MIERAPRPHRSRAPARTVPRRCLLAAMLAALAAPLGCRAECSELGYQKMRPPAYPAEAIQAKAQGKVLLAVTVDAEGKPEDIGVEQSSGNDALDRAAADAVAEWRFNPRVCDGKPVKARAMIPLDFDLSQAAAVERAAARPVVAADTQPMPRPTAAATLRFLKSEAQPLGEARTIGSTTSSTYAMPAQSALFVVEETSEREPQKWLSVIRLRSVADAAAERLLYAQVCDGDAAWCRSVLYSYVRYLEDHPPPPMPH
jgi:TonB family protein